MAQDLYINTTKIDTNKVWIWGLSPHPSFRKLYIIFLNEDLPKDVFLVHPFT